MNDQQPTTPGIYNGEPVETAPPTPGSAAPIDDLVSQDQHMLRLLEVLYRGDYFTITDLATEAAFNSSCVRRRLESLMAQGWVERIEADNKHHYHITDKALLRVHQLASANIDYAARKIAEKSDELFKKEGGHLKDVG